MARRSRTRPLPVHHPQKRDRATASLQRVLLLACGVSIVQASTAASPAFSVVSVQARCAFVDLDVNGICSGNRFSPSTCEGVREKARNLCGVPALYEREDDINSAARPPLMAVITLHLDLSRNIVVDLVEDEQKKDRAFLRFDGPFDVDSQAAAFCEQRGLDQLTGCPAAVASHGHLAYVESPPMGMELVQRDGAFSWKGRRVAKHISFFFNEARLPFINRMLAEADMYPVTTDIFIHVNRRFNVSRLQPYRNGRVDVVVHRLNKTHEFEMRHACRPLMEEQLKSPGAVPYAAFMFVEDDILVYKETLQYWIDYHRGLLAHNYNLGFLRIEYDEAIEGGREYLSDFDGKNNGRLEYAIRLNGTEYVMNSVNTHTASWIYNRDEFTRFVASKYWDSAEVEGNYGYVESQSLALHGLLTPWYKATLIPLVAGNKLHPHCKVHHMANNYLHYQKSGNCSNKHVCGGDRKVELATIPFDQAVVNVSDLTVVCGDCDRPGIILALTFLEPTPPIGGAGGASHLTH